MCYAVYLVVTFIWCYSSEEYCSEHLYHNDYSEERKPTPVTKPVSNSQSFSFMTPLEISTPSSVFENKVTMIVI